MLEISFGDKLPELKDKADEDKRREIRKRRLMRNVIDKETYDRIKIDKDSYNWKI